MLPDQPGGRFPCPAVSTPGGTLGQSAALEGGQDDEDQLEEGGSGLKEHREKGRPKRIAPSGRRVALQGTRPEVEDPGAAWLDYMPMPRSYQGVRSSTSW